MLCTPLIMNDSKICLPFSARGEAPIARRFTSSVNGKRVDLLFLLRHRRHAPLHLLLRHVLDVRHECPLMPERIGEHPRAVAIEFVLERTQYRPARVDRTL